MNAIKLIADLAQNAAQVQRRPDEDPKALALEINKAFTWVGTRKELWMVSSNMSRAYVALAMAHSAAFREFAGEAITARFDVEISRVLEKIETITRPVERSPLKSSLISASETARGL